MYTYLIAIIIVATIAILYVWYATSNLYYISDDTILVLSGDEHKALDNWYKQNIIPTLSFDLNENVVAMKFLSSIFNADFDSKLLVIGEGLREKYRQIVKRDISNEIGDNDCLISIRDIIGINGEIAIIHNDRLREIMRSKLYYDPKMLSDILENKYEKLLQDYMQRLLKYRWDKIKELHDDNVINNSGSYLYLKDVNIDNVESNNGRINLLCTDAEFENLIIRWKNKLNTLPAI